MVYALLLVGDALFLDPVVTVAPSRVGPEAWNTTDRGSNPNNGEGEQCRSPVVWGSAGQNTEPNQARHVGVAVIQGGGGRNVAGSHTVVNPMLLV